MHYLFLYGSVSEEILLIKTFGLIMWKVTKKVKWQSFVLNVKKKKMTKKVAIKEGKLLAVGMQYDAKKWISYIKKSLISVGDSWMTPRSVLTNFLIWKGGVSETFLMCNTRNWK